MDNKTLLIALSLQEGIGPRTQARLVQLWPDLNQLFRRLRAGTLDKQLPAKLLVLLKNMNWNCLEKTLLWLKGPNRYVLTCFDANYPRLLQEIPDKPMVLYLEGHLSAFNHPLMAVVGSRNPSPYGIKVAHEWCPQLAHSGIGLVSGLAIGIDSLVHQGALAAKKPTIAVLGSGLNHIYPYRNRALAEAITQDGLLVSEFFVDKGPKPYHFPIRNRIISGLSLATLVLEASEKSGTLITANLCVEQNRELYVLPGSVDNPLSQGPHRLLLQGANLVMNCQELIQDFHLQAKKCYN